MISRVVFGDGSSIEVNAVFARAPFTQHCDIPQQLGCELNEQGYIKVDNFQRTTVDGVYAAGDNSSGFRAVVLAASTGAAAGIFINKTLIEEAF